MDESSDSSSSELSDWSSDSYDSSSYDSSSDLEETDDRGLTTETEEDSEIEFTPNVKKCIKWESSVEIMIQSLNKVLLPCGTRAFNSRSCLNLHADGTIGVNRRKVHSFFKKAKKERSVVGRCVDEIAQILLAYDVSPKSDTAFLLDLLCSRGDDEGALINLVKRKTGHSRLLDTTAEHILAYQNANTAKACRQAVSEFVDYFVYCLSTNSLFGVKSEVVQGNCLKTTIRFSYSFLIENEIEITYKYSINLEHYGISDPSLRKKLLDSNIGAAQEVVYKFVPGELWLIF